MKTSKYVSLLLIVAFLSLSLAPVAYGGDREIGGYVDRAEELNAASKKQVQPEEMISQQEAEEQAKRQIITEYGESTSYKILGSGRSESEGVDKEHKNW